jgi:hypothetical protein
MEVNGQLYVPLPNEQEAGWEPDTVLTTWRREISSPYRGSNSDTSVVEPVARSYSDYSVFNVKLSFPVKLLFNKKEVQTYRS